jgi:hypothetical protein
MVNNGLTRLPCSSADLAACCGSACKVCVPVPPTPPHKSMHNGYWGCITCGCTGSPFPSQSCTSFRTHNRMVLPAYPLLFACLSGYLCIPLHHNGRASQVMVCYHSVKGSGRLFTLGPHTMQCMSRGGCTTAGLCQQRVCMHMCWDSLKCFSSCSGAQQQPGWSVLLL